MLDYVDQVVHPPSAILSHSALLKRKVCFMVDLNYVNRKENITFQMRSELVNWHDYDHYIFRLHLKNLFLTVNNIDRYLAFNNVLLRKLQLVGVTKIHIASKYKKIEALEMGNFVDITRQAYRK